MFLIYKLVIQMYKSNSGCVSKTKWSIWIFCCKSFNYLSIVNQIHMLIKSIFKFDNVGQAFELLEPTEPTHTII